MAVAEWLKWMVLLLIDGAVGICCSTRPCWWLAGELWQRTADMAEMRNKWSDAMRDQGVDVLVYPAMPLAFKHGLSVFLTAACSYMFPE
jgi:hypothetical protein